jgi:hypothetical protein
MLTMYLGFVGGVAAHCVVSAGGSGPRVKATAWLAPGCRWCVRRPVLVHCVLLLFRVVIRPCCSPAMPTSDGASRARVCVCVHGRCSTVRRAIANAHAHPQGVVNSMLPMDRTNDHQEDDGWLSSSSDSDSDSDPSDSDSDSADDDLE